MTTVAEIIPIRAVDGGPAAVEPVVVEPGDAGTIYLMICKGFSGEIVRAEISPLDTVEQALPVIADQVGYYSPDWEKIGLYNLTRDFEYAMDMRFVDTGTRAGDLLIMADGAACHKE
jgi:hypothetical protein